MAKMLFLFLFLFTVIHGDDSFLKIKCSHPRAQRFSPLCRRYLGHSDNPPPTPFSSHQLIPTTTHHRSIPEVVEEAEEEVIGVAVWVLPILGLLLCGYSGGVLYAKCFLKLSIGRSFLLGLNCQCVRGQFNPDANSIPLPLNEPQNAPSLPALEF